jgi:hypothetical protein
LYRTARSTNPVDLACELIFSRILLMPCHTSALQTVRGTLHEVVLGLAPPDVSLVCVVLLQSSTARGGAFARICPVRRSSVMRKASVRRRWLKEARQRCHPVAGVPVPQAVRRAAVRPGAQQYGE